MSTTAAAGQVTSQTAGSTENPQRYIEKYSFHHIGDLIAAFQYLKGPTRQLERDFYKAV